MNEIASIKFRFSNIHVRSDVLIISKPGCEQDHEAGSLYRVKLAGKKQGREVERAGKWVLPTSFSG